MVAAVLVVLVVALCMGPMWQGLTTHALGDHYDGVKNQFTFLHHIVYGQFPTHFSGSNAPYGDHIVFTDNQPLFALPFWFINQILHLDWPVWLAVFKLLLLVDLVVGAALMQRILVRLGVAALPAAAGGALIVLGSPQLIRLAFHYSLAYTWPYVLTLYLLLQARERPTTGQLLGIGLVVLLAGLLHLYHLAIAGLLVGGFWLVGWLHGRLHWREVLRAVVPTVVVPVVVLLLLIKCGSTGAEFRPAHPWGLDSYNARWEGLLLPVKLPSGDALHRLVGIRRLSPETLLYVGFPTALVLIGGLLAGLYLLARRRWAAVGQPFGRERGVENRLLWTALLCVVFAMGFPLALLPSTSGEYVGLLAQFRSLARFAFPAYYVLTALVLALLWRWASQGPRFAGVVAVMMAVWAWEIYAQFGPKVELQAKPVPQFAWLERVKSSDYDAILVLPYFAIGSENYSFDSQGRTQEIASWLSLKTGLPMVNFSLSRTRFDQSWTQLGRFAFGRVEARDSFQARQRYLVVWDKSVPDVRPKEADALQAGHLLHEDAAVAVYALHGQALLARERQRMAREQPVQMPDSALRYKPAVEQQFEDGPAEAAYRSSGGHLVPMPVLIYEGRLPEAVDYEFTAWVRLYEPGAQPLNLEYEAEDGSQLSHELIQYIDRVDGPWARIRVPLAASLHRSRFRLGLRSSSGDRRPYATDNWLLAPAP